MASTRRVPFAIMVSIIASCRKLTLASLPNQTDPSSTSAKLVASARERADFEVVQRQDMLGALLSTWIMPSSSSEPPPLLALPGPRSSARQTEEPPHTSYLSMGLSMVSGIVPNTLWCGLGDRAANYSELGVEYRVDACCRAHDHCPIRLKPFTTDYGLVNWSMSTRSHCDCDLDFDRCLKAVNSTLSNVIRVLYFRFVGLQCINTPSES